MRSRAALGVLVLAVPFLALPALGAANGVFPGPQINIDIGTEAGAPSPAYVTHAGGGVWNVVPFDATAVPLVFADGTPSTATITITGGTAFAFDHPGTSGDDEALMDDGSRSAGTQTITIQNCDPFAFYAYAWSPDSATTSTEVSLNQIGGLVVGGAWPGVQAWQTTYESVSYCDAVTDTLTLYVRPAAGSAFGTINGLQINGDGADHCASCNGAAWQPCPCDNPGFPDTGCDNAQGSGGVGLRILARSTEPNGVTMRGEGFPATSSPAAVLMRSPVRLSEPIPFGDGLFCIGSPIIRLAATTAVGGVSLHTIGHSAMAGPGKFHYQIWYRSTPSAYCSPSAFNLSQVQMLYW